MAEQKNDEFIEPSPEEIVLFTKEHVSQLEQSDGDDVWLLAGMNHVLLHTVGRRSGRLHKVALPFWADHNGHRVVVGSFAGAAKHPSWYVNLSDRTANPQLLVRVQRATYWSVPEILDGDDYTKTWAALVTDRPYYADYQTRTNRRIPLIRLPESTPIARRA